MSSRGPSTNSTTSQIDFSAFDTVEERDYETSSTQTTPRPGSSAVAEGTVIPGGYDFEPQDYEGGATGRSEGRVNPPFHVSRFSLSRGQDAYGGTADETDGEVTTRSAPRSWRNILRFGGGGGNRHSTDEGATGGESNRLLFSQEESDETDSERRIGELPSASASYPPRNIHLPLPPRPPTFAPHSIHNDTTDPENISSMTPTLGGSGRGRVYGGGSSNDGVFSNLAAKPDGSANVDVVGEGPDKDEVLPAYEAAALDSTPPYWETTVITPGGFLGPDDICVDGMPVGNLFSFAWNLLVSMSFQFVGFLLTYLLHTTHAAKNGSRAGLGITLIQLGFYLKQHTDYSGDPLFDDSPSRDETGLNGNAGPRIENVRWSWWGGEIEDIDTPAAVSSASATLGILPTQISNGLSGALEASESGRSTNSSSLPTLMGNGPTEAELNSMSIATNEWMSFALVTIGSFLLIGGCLSYWRAVRYARAMRAGQGPGADSENTVAVS
ncbi:hypothetical protein JCM3765_007757 [Sporobolomyces pararoseus]